MNRARLSALLAASALTLASQPLDADVRADEKTHVEFAGMLGKMMNLFGGKAAREGVTSTVAVKGDRKATLNDTSGQIIDLNEEKVYDLDLKKKTLQGDDLRRAAAQDGRSAQEGRRRARRKEQGKPAEPPTRTRSRRSRSTSTSRTPARRRRSTASTRTRSS